MFSPCFFMFAIFAIASLAESFEPDIKMGPILHFNGQDLDKKMWHVSALYLLKKKEEAHPLLKVEVDLEDFLVMGKVLGHKFGYDFVRYDIAILQTHEQQSVKYGLPLHSPFRYEVPAIGQVHRLLYHSCNGYQFEEDKQKVGGISPMWNEINRRHQVQSYFIQLGGGDQLYADGLIGEGGKCSLEPRHGKSYGVFALPSLKAWLKDKENLGCALFTDLMRAEVERFYFDHYVRQYNEEGFKETMATIPSIVQIDDHDVHDGCGSYPDFLQNGFVMAGIRRIGMWYAFSVQHQIVADDYIRSATSSLKPYHFLHVVNDGKIAIYGVDTRSERTAHQILSKTQWEKVFNDLYGLSHQVEHLIFMLGIPVVYASSKNLDTAFKKADQTPFAEEVLSHLPGTKDVFKKNEFDLFELADDLRDGWSHPAHIEERDTLVKSLHKFAEKMGIRVVIISGDVHLGGYGTIVTKEGAMANNAISQIISSPVGNITPPKFTARFLGWQGGSPQWLCDNSSKMCLHKLRKTSNNKEKKYRLIAHRNYVSLTLLPSLDLHVEWSAENQHKGMPHDLSYQYIPHAVKDSSYLKMKFNQMEKL